MTVDRVRLGVRASRRPCSSRSARTAPAPARSPRPVPSGSASCRGSARSVAEYGAAPGAPKFLDAARRAARTRQREPGRRRGPRAPRLRGRPGRRRTPTTPSSSAAFGGAPSLRRRAPDLPRPRLPLVGLARATDRKEPRDGSRADSQDRVRTAPRRPRRRPRGEIAPHAAQHDREASFPFESLAAVKRSGYLAAPIPEELGGLGVTSLHDVLVASSRLARGDAALTLGVNMHLVFVLNVVRALAGVRGRRATNGAPRAFGATLEQIARERNRLRVRGAASRGRI